MQAGVELMEDMRLHGKCTGCMKADWIADVCQVITNPRQEWQRGRCRYRTEDPDWEEKIEQAKAQFQQARCPGIDEDLIGWLMATKPPSIRDKEPILQIPAPAAGKSSSRSKRKRKKPFKFTYNPYY